MLTVAVAAANGSRCNKADIEFRAIVVGEYSIIELRIRVAICRNELIFNNCATCEMFYVTNNDKW